MRALAENHARFLEFVERRTGDPAEAEDLLQEAFVRALERGAALRDGESAVAWVYRVLRNALIDRHRAAGARGHGVDAASAGLAADEDVAVLRAEACRCVVDLLPTLRPEHAELLRRVDVEGARVKDAAGDRHHREQRRRPPPPRPQGASAPAAPARPTAAWTARAGTPEIPPDRRVMDRGPLRLPGRETDTAPVPTETTHEATHARPRSPRSQPRT